MGWSIGEFEGRDIGYGVPAVCDHPDCEVKIDRGLSYVCGSNPYGQPFGCGLFFCERHLSYAESDKVQDQLCERCCAYYDAGMKGYPVPFEPKPDVPEWINHKLTHESWQQWRDENPEEVAEMRKRLA